MKWKHHEYLLAQRAVNTLKVRIVLHEPLSGLFFTVHWHKKMFWKLFKKYWTNRTQTFFFVLFCFVFWSYVFFFFFFFLKFCFVLFVCLFVFLVFLVFFFFFLFLFLFFFFSSFSTLAHKVNEAWKWHKIGKFDLWSQFTFCANEGPSSFHLHLPLSSYFIHVSLFVCLFVCLFVFSWVLDGATSFKQFKTAPPFSSVIGMSYIGGFKNRFFFFFLFIYLFISWANFGAKVCGRR